MITVVLLHAFPLSPEMFDPQRQALSEAGWSVEVPHLLDPTRPWQGRPTMTSMAERVLSDMRAAGHTSFAVAGLSMGGYIAMEMLRQQPNRIRGLALLDTKCTADTDEAASARHQFAARVAEEGMGWVPEAMIPALLGETTRHRRPPVVDRVTQWILQADPDQVAWAQQAMATRADSTHTLESFRQPSVVVVGQEDTLSPWSDASTMATALGGVPVAEVSKSGHLSSVECPNRVSDLLLAWAARLGK